MACRARRAAPGGLHRRVTAGAISPSTVRVLSVFEEATGDSDAYHPVTVKHCIIP
nr:hypothetical protein [Thermoflexus sp.]